MQFNERELFLYKVKTIVLFLLAVSCGALFTTLLIRLLS